jgi:hypothetical protein
MHRRKRSEKVWNRSQDLALRAFDRPGALTAGWAIFHGALRCPWTAKARFAGHRAERRDQLKSVHKFIV